VRGENTYTTRTDIEIFLQVYKEIGLEISVD